MIQKYCQRFWFRFVPSDQPTSLNLGCGVTAYSREDAERLLEECLGTPLPKVVEVIEDITYDDLEQNHVAANMGDVSRRGVWFPNCPPPVNRGS